MGWSCGTFHLATQEQSGDGGAFSQRRVVYITYNRHTIVA